MSNIQKKILERLEASSLKAFTSRDFMDLGNYKLVSKALETLTNDGTLRRARRGIYYLHKIHPVLGIEEMPSIDDIAHAIARQFNWTITPSGNYVLNMLGLSTQVPQQFVYISSGPYNAFDVFGCTIIFKHSASKDICGLSNNNQLVIQAIKELGYYGYSLKPIKKWTSLKSTKGYLKKIMLPNSLRHYDFDATLYKRTVKFLKKEDPTHIFIYGEIDPWSASGVCTWLNCKKKKNMRVYVQPRGSHGSRISNMPEDMKAEIIERLTKWLQ